MALRTRRVRLTNPLDAQSLGPGSIESILAIQFSPAPELSLSKAETYGLRYDDSSMISALIAASFLAQPAELSRSIDSDKDGLLDAWEINGFGPLNPKIHGCDPKRADMIVCFRIRPGMTAETLRPTIERMKKFYAEMPYTNINGVKGLNLIPIVLDPLGAEHNNKGYIELYETAMPKEWRGLAHGVMVDNHPGGGGQANRPDWAGTGYNWWTIVHEVGHQLGLPHSPLGSNVGSPFHASLMNYDYSYQLLGDSQKVQFSTGKFAKLKLSEKNLDENIPFPASDFEFLTKQPHFYSVKAVDYKSCQIDWNRNGIFGEKGYQANINDGYAVEFNTPAIKGPKASGAPSLAVVKGSLYCSIPQSDKADITSPTQAHPAKLQISIIDKAKKFAPAYESTAADIHGDISTFGFNGRLLVAHSAGPGWKLKTFEPVKSTLKPLDEKTFSTGSDPFLSVIDSKLTSITRDSATGELSLTDHSTGSPISTALGIKSLKPASFVWHQQNRKLAVACVVDKEKQPGAIVIHEFTKSAEGWKKSGEPLAVGGTGSPARTSNRPLISIVNGLYIVHCKGWQADASQSGLNYSCRQIATGTGWWIKMMGNEWANSRSVCSTVPFETDVAYAYRWHGGPEDNSIWLHLKGSGIDDGTITDFDEVTFIFEQGLRNSLQAVRNEQWRRMR